ncbi:MAG TPA: hypothetical protein PKD68_00040 [Candidatus Saccharibacteria bacterium]|nr:hypothetical protein [Candidatus Saccharibacteria bacterium]
MIDLYSDRFEYLSLDGVVGFETFGFERYLNQKFYTSTEWRTIRNRVIVRDDGCDLGHPDRPILGKIIVHHMNPMVSRDIRHAESYILDPEFLISVSLSTHNAIHYGSKEVLQQKTIERKPGDTRLW